jgi:DNA-binding transcriptional regulator YiaG
MTKAKKKPAGDPVWMTGPQFEKIIVKLGFNQSSFARAISINDRTVRSWVSERYPVPRIVAQLLNLMIETEATAENLKP